MAGFADVNFKVLKGLPSDNTALASALAELAFAEDVDQTVGMQILNLRDTVGNSWVPVTTDGGTLLVFGTPVALASGASYTGPISFSGTDNYGIKLSNLSTADINLLTPESGMLPYDSTLNRVKVYNGSAWRELLDTSGGQTVAGSLETTGTLIVKLGTNSNQSIKNTGNGFAGLSIVDDYTTTLNSYGQYAIYVNRNGVGLRMRNGMQLAWTAGNADDPQDLAIYRGAANILEQRNSTNAQTQRLFNTFTSGSGTNASNNIVGEWLAIEAISNTFWITPRAGTSGGTARDLVLGRAGTEAIRIASNGLITVSSGSPVTFGSYISTSSDAYASSLCLRPSDDSYRNFLARGGVGIIEQRNSTAAQTFRIANTWTSSTDNEFLSLNWTSNVARIETIKGSGGGTARDLVLGRDGTEKFRITSSSAEFVDLVQAHRFLTSDAAFRVGNAFSAGLSGAFISSSWMFGWGTGSNPNSGVGTTLSRASDGVVQIGTTGANASGSLLLTNLTASQVASAGNSWTGAILVGACPGSGTTSIGLIGATSTGIGLRTGRIDLAVGGSGVASLATGAFYIGQTSFLGFGNNGNAHDASVPDAGFYYGGSGILERRNSTTAQTDRLFNTFTSGSGTNASNTIIGEWLATEWVSNVAWITTRKGTSGGTARDLVLGTDGTERMRIASTGLVTVGTFAAGVKIAGGAYVENSASNFTVSLGWNQGQVQVNTSGWFGVANSNTEARAAAVCTLSRASDGVWQMGTSGANALGSLNLTNMTSSGRIILSGSNLTAPTGSDVSLTTDSYTALRITNAHSSFSIGPGGGQCTISSTVGPTCIGNGLYINSNAFGTGNQVNLFAEANHTLSQYSTTSPQAYQLYNTRTDASNYERGFIKFASNQFQIGTEIAGTGVARDVVFEIAGDKTIYYKTNSTQRMTVSSAGVLAVNVPFVGSPGANTSILTSSGSYSLTGSNASSMITLSGTLNTTGSPSLFKIDVTNTASGSSTNFAEYLIGGSSRYKLTKDGIGIYYYGVSLGSSVGIEGYYGDANAMARSTTNRTFLVGHAVAGMVVAQEYAYQFSASAVAAADCFNDRDTRISRASAGVIQVGTTSNNASGSMNLTNLTASGTVTQGFQSLSANPTTVDIPTDRVRMVKNTTSGVLSIWANDGGVMKSVALT